MTLPPLPAALGLAGFLAALIVQRLWELGRSRRNARALAARGGIETGARHFPLFVVLHAGFPLALAAEVLALGARPGSTWPLWLALLAAAEGLRAAAIHALGERWTVRIVVVPGLAPVRRGVYRVLRHPNYVAVSVELAAAALLFGAWRTAIAASALNAVALAIRIPAEERAIARAGGDPAALATPAPAP
jgi:methyltransferase